MKKNQLRPGIRFRGFEQDWEHRKLNSLIDYLNGKGHEGEQKEKGKYELINLNSVSIDGGLKPSGRFIDDSIDTLNTGDLVMILSDLAYGNFLGRVAIIPEDNKFVLNQRVAALKPKINTNTFYLYYYINNSQLYFKRNGAGSSQLNLNKDGVLGFNVFLPNSEEQIKISTLLKELDKTITLYQRKLSEIDKLKKTMLSILFPKKDNNIPEVRLKGFTDDWEQRQLGEVSSIGTGSSDLQDSDNNGIYPFFVRSENIERSNRYLFDGEAILIPGEGRIGDIYHYISGKFDYHQRVYKISGFEDYITDGKFILYYLSQNFKRHAVKFTVKATVDSLRLPTLLNFELNLPGHQEQVKISEVFSKIDKTITLHQCKLEKLEEIKKYLLSKMFV